MLTLPWIPTFMPSYIFALLICSRSTHHSCVQLSIVTMTLQCFALPYNVAPSVVISVLPINTLSRIHGCFGSSSMCLEPAPAWNTSSPWVVIIPHMSRYLLLCNNSLHQPFYRILCLPPCSTWNSVRKQAACADTLILSTVTLITM